jgi:hypothetical protein
MSGTSPAMDLKAVTDRTKATPQRHKKEIVVILLVLFSYFEYLPVRSSPQKNCNQYLPAPALTNRPLI